MQKIKSIKKYGENKGRKANNIALKIFVFLLLLKNRQIKRINNIIIRLFPATSSDINAIVNPIGLNIKAKLDSTAALSLKYFLIVINIKINIIKEVKEDPRNELNSLVGKSM